MIFDNFIHDERCLAVNITEGCCKGECVFCEKHKASFRIRTSSEIAKDISNYTEDFTPSTAIFTSSDSAAFPVDYLTETMDFVRKSKPSIKAFCFYAKTQALLMKSVGDLIELRKAGMRVIRQKIVSGNQDILDSLRCRESLQEQREAAELVKAAGITLSQIIYTGISGSFEFNPSALMTAEHLNIMQPDEVISLSLGSNTAESLRETSLITDSLFLNSRYFVNGDFRFRFPEEKSSFAAILTETINGNRLYLNKSGGTDYGKSHQIHS